MKTKTILTFVLAVPLALASCSDKKPDAEGENAAASTDEYPLTICVVSEEELGSMGDPVEIVHEGTTVKFCCKSCIPDFKADPAKYLAKLKK